eukprot:6191845-Pleurochrysis_carterae.AAC.2
MSFNPIHMMLNVDVMYDFARLCSSRELSVARPRPMSSHLVLASNHVTFSVNTTRFKGGGEAGGGGGENGGDGGKNGGSGGGRGGDGGNGDGGKETRLRRNRKMDRSLLHPSQLSTTKYTSSSFVNIPKSTPAPKG